MDLGNKKVTVFGLGKSGLAAARKLSAMGAKVRATDAKSSLDIQELDGIGIEVELGGHTLKSIEDAEMIVVSPGVHLDIPVLEEAKKRGIPIISEIELAYQFVTKPIVAVTGTNGKTTTTTLIGEMLRAAGKKVSVGGNIGSPLVEVDDSKLDFIVAEISSYQLETVDKFKPWVSVILNIQSDHLERHRSMQEYVKQKARIFMNQTGDDYLVYNEDDPIVKQMVLGARCRVLGFSKDRAAEIITINPEEIKIPGRHNLENALAAASAAYLCGVSKETVVRVLKTFPGVEHRIEYAVTVDRIDFYNDSKGTNPDSTMVAIDTFSNRGIVLILGGRDKGTDLAPMVEKVKKNVKEVVLIGEAAQRFEEALRSKGYSHIHHAGSSMAEAVNKSFSLASPEDVVLLSPACASFDMFNNYEERGRAFKEIVRNLTPPHFIRHPSPSKMERGMNSGGAGRKG
jgi:UDP-N-acetylmuramoylalanine--D-glutamate ligase